MLCVEIKHFFYVGDNSSLSDLRERTDVSLISRIYVEQTVVHQLVHQDPVLQTQKHTEQQAEPDRKQKNPPHFQTP